MNNKKRRINRRPRVLALTGYRNKTDMVRMLKGEISEWIGNLRNDPEKAIAQNAAFLAVSFCNHPDHVLAFKNANCEAIDRLLFGSRIEQEETLVELSLMLMGSGLDRDGYIVFLAGLMIERDLRQQEVA